MEPTEAAPAMRITPTDLGDHVMPDACPKCLWIKSKVPALPFQIFPGVFRVIDGVSKSIVRKHFDITGAVPEYIEKVLGKVKRMIDPPHYTKFSYTTKDGVQLRGETDDILVLEDDSLAIIDYKTAQVTEKQDSLLPKYEMQLNAYAYIAENTGMGRVSALALVYMEPMPLPVTTSPGADTAETPAGFHMGFKATVKPIQKDVMLVPEALRRVQELRASEQPPAGREGCRDCLAMENLHRAAEGRLSEIVKPERKSKAPKPVPAQAERER